LLVYGSNAALAGSLSGALSSLAANAP
jgi:hypothetical protein